MTKKSVIELARQVKTASTVLSRLTRSNKDRAVLEMARHITDQIPSILASNKKDLEASKPLVQSGTMPESVYRRLKLDEAKVGEMIAGLHQVAALDDPVGKVILATELDSGLSLYRVTCPLGVIGVIFESRPDAIVQIVALCLKSGNGVLLKGGSEAGQSNRVLFDIVRKAATESGIPAEVMELLDRREDVKDLLDAEGVVDLIIPRGSNSLVRYVQDNTRIPVLGHAEGICHIYVDRAADLKKATNVTVDAKIQYPAACNAVETLLVHTAVAPVFLPTIRDELEQHGVLMKFDEASIAQFGLENAPCAAEDDWRTEYCDLVLSVRTVDSLDDAIQHINTYGSHHTDAIITEDADAFDQFFAGVDSAGVFLNASTRFADGYRYGFGAEVGISTGKLHPRGPVGLEGLVTYKYKLVGIGQTVSTYSGPQARAFIHKALDRT